MGHVACIIAIVTEARLLGVGGPSCLLGITEELNIIVSKIFS